MLNALLLLLIACVWGKPIDVSVEAPWRTPSETVLVLETISQYNQSSYFPLLSVILSAREKGEIQVGTEKERQLLFDTARNGHFLSESQLTLAEQEYKLGTVLPHFEQNYQQFEAIENPAVQECPVVMWTEGTASCDRSDLYALQFTESKLEQIPGLTETDKVIGSGSQWVVLYADIDSPEFPDWHSALLALALEQKITYVLRYRSSGSIKGTKVAGYGVGLHLKRTDYLVVDDRQLDGEKLQLNLEATNQVPASKVPYLSFGAAKQVRNHEGSDEEKLALLQDLSFNFPIHASTLATDASELDEEAELKANPEASLGANGLFVNGLLLDKSDVYSFFETLRKEELLINALQGYLPGVTDIPELLVSGAALDTPTADGNETVLKRRYDLRATADAIGWINDIEVDRPYQELDPSISALAESTGPFAPIRRNLHSVVLVGKLEDQRTLALLASLFRLVARQVPLQIGLVSPSPVWRKVAQLGTDARQAFLVTLLRTQNFEEALEMARLAYDAAERPIPSATGDSAEWMERFGIAADADPTLFVNGYSLNAEDWQELAMDIFINDAEQLRLLAASYLNPDVDQDDIIDLDGQSLRDILFSSGVPRRNTLVDPTKPVEFVPWPLSPMQLFTNPETTDEEALANKQTVLFSSSFSSPDRFDLLDHLLHNAKVNGTVEVAVRPLKGVDERFYKSLLDKSFNMFRFSRDLVKAAKAHLYEGKSAPKVFGAAAEPPLPADSLPAEADSLVVDGRLIPLNDELTVEVLDELLERELPRVRRLRQRIPNITGVGIAALSSSAQNRIQIRETDIPDISVKSKNRLSSSLSFVINPASAEAQELLALAKLAREADLSVDIFLTPAKLERMPTRLYRGVLNRFEHARFEDNVVDEHTLYTTEIVEPPSWLTVASDCEYDLDNVVLSMVKDSELKAVYTLRSLLIEGFALGPDAPGTRLQLVDLDGSISKDTVIMANLGYFQLQAERPGVYHVCIADESKAFYGYDTTADCIPVPVTGFTGAKLQPGIVSGPAESQVAKSLRSQSASKSSSSLWGKVGGFFGTKEEPSKSKPADVNIFTVASGHLYERFASIMMLSVMNQTKHSVKFWLIENFMSPKFKELVPELAAANGFDYEFVSYKWPSWLRSQTEKQRVIWGYKMLFLDVLFPQDLSNVIFVDSDQIVRTDFMDLIDLDLDGAPYAFTPMGDDREETEPFRFWKQGYWKRTLLDNGLKYHISALYRVDLNRFRELRVGDLMRQQYQRLSADPESLANLDQDLPNSMQPHVPIYSLSPDWLWCETWCSDEGLEHARTIDLCNNPLTKEPKLDRARRQIPEWVEYDRKVSEFQQQVDDARNKLRQGAAESNKQPKGEPVGDHSNEHKFEDLDDDEDDHTEL